MVKLRNYFFSQVVPSLVLRQLSARPSDVSPQVAFLPFTTYPEPNVTKVTEFWPPPASQLMSHKAFQLSLVNFLELAAGK